MERKSSSCSSVKRRMRTRTKYASDIYQPVKPAERHTRRRHPAVPEQWACSLFQRVKSLLATEVALRHNTQIQKTQVARRPRPRRGARRRGLRRRLAGRRARRARPFPDSRRRRRRRGDGGAAPCPRGRRAGSPQTAHAPLAARRRAAAARPGKFYSATATSRSCATPQAVAVASQTEDEHAAAHARVIDAPTPPCMYKERAVLKHIVHASQQQAGPGPVPHGSRMN